MTPSVPGARGTVRTHRPSRSLPPASIEWAYFFDIDGTLVDLAESPSDVQPDRDLRRLVADLFAQGGGAVALISGRSLTDIDRLFPRVQLPAAGQHGLERRDATGRLHLHPSAAESLDAIRVELREATARHPDLLLEDKGLSLALHFRRAPHLAGFAHRLMRSMQNRLGDEYCVQPGKRVVELKPAGRDKGVAILEFMQEVPFQRRTPVFLGDDATDEYGFDMVNSMNGHSVKVGPGATAARWRLGDVLAVRAWLDTLRTTSSAANDGNGEGSR